MNIIDLFEDGKKYAIVQEKNINNTVYTLFVNINDFNDICLRKTINEDGEEFFAELESTEEVLNILKLFTE